MCKGELFKRRAKGSRSSNPSDLLAAIVVLNPQQCAIQCQDKSGCLSFSYNAGNGNCLLYNKSTKYLTLVDAPGYTIYERVSRKCQIHKNGFSDLLKSRL